jgi:hypothetical protein
VVEEDYQTAQRYDQAVRLSKQMVYQMTRVTMERGALRHDDRLDALAMAVGYWVEQMARDEQLGIDDALEDARRLELEDFMDMALRPRVNRKSTPKALTWV